MAQFPNCLAHNRMPLTPQSPNIALMVQAIGGGPEEIMRDLAGRQYGV